MITQETLRKRLLDLLKTEGVSQKHIAIQTHINQGLLSQFKNGKCELRMIDSENLDDYLVSKGY